MEMFLGFLKIDAFWLTTGNDCMGHVWVLFRREIYLLWKLVMVSLLKPHMSSGQIKLHLE